ncbi:hypothetical protein CB0940_10712 [Cercospora beticola]|uniref:Uncharacterized protein n=2 Tax=Cercospora beticola TaxID=122368 RepID=A0A2G5HT17_CERBT|nr:hypothetical protein CB0940_10712 [Cercospora beticola]PIA95687.1 hypothetical protein CB0940_10712 [Cercospora beticola]
MHDDQASSKRQAIKLEMCRPSLCPSRVPRNFSSTMTSTTTMAYDIHVVRKAKISEHSTISISSSLPPLPENKIRAIPRIVSLTANNLSYAKGGHIMHWWDAFPLPSHLPSPHNDATQYGIVPVWGYAEILESKIADVVQGSMIWGLWPSYNIPVDLELQTAFELKGHYLDVSRHRDKLWKFYNHYVVASDKIRYRDLDQKTLERMAWEANVLPAAGWMLSRFVFGSSAPVVHPSGLLEGWSEEDADLSKAVVVSLSASGRTARAFAHALARERREDASGPLGFLAVSSSTDGSFIPEIATFPTQVIQYADLQSSHVGDWIANLAPDKIVVLDFGGRGDSLEQLQHTLQECLPGTKVTIIGIGGEAKAQSPEEIADVMQRRAKLTNRMQMNTARIQETAIAKLGAEKFFAEKDEACKVFLEHGGLKGLKLQWGKRCERRQWD